MTMALRQPRPAAPPRSRRHRLVPIIQLTGIALFVALASLRFLVAPLDRYDEGVTLTDGMLTAAGHLPFRDFWMTYGPLDVYVLAAVFHLLAINVVVERLLGVAVLLLLGVAAYAITGRLGLSGAMRLLLTGLISAGALAVPAFTSAFFVNLIGLLALLAFLVSLDRDQRRWPLLAGAIVGLCAFSRPEYALALGAGLGAGYLALGVRGPQLRRRLAPYLAGALAVGGLLWGITIWQAGIGPVWFDVVDHALNLYPRARSIPIGQGHEGGFVIVLTVVFALTWLWAAWHAWRQRAEPAERARTVAVLVAGLLLFNWVRIRADGIHALGVWPLVAILLALLLAGRRRRTRPAPPLLEALVALAGILLFCVGAGGLALRDLALPHAAADVPRAGLSGQRSWMPAAQLAALIQDIDARTPDHQPIWVGLQRNDLAMLNDTSLYFLSGRDPGTAYYVAVPGLTNAEPVQRTIACQLERSGVTLAVLGPDAAGEPWNLSSVPQSQFLDQWLAQRTVSRTPFGPYQLLTLRPGPAPGGPCSASGGGVPDSGWRAARGTSPPNAGSGAPGSGAS
jgi:hypothetical protein